MPKRAHNVLEGMGESLLSLARKHCDSHQWASWLKVQNGMEHVGAIQILLRGAAVEGDADMVLALLNAGASAPGRRSKECLTPLHAAAEGGSLAVVTSLLKTSAKSDVNTKIFGRSPLHVAVRDGHADVALALVRAGGDVHLTDTRGRSPLMRAAFAGRADLVNDLLLNDSRVDATDNSGNQALGLAVQRRHLGVVKVLLRAGALPGTRGENNLSPVDVAVKCGDTDTLCCLLAVAPNLDILDDGGRSALWIAVQDGHPKAIEVLADAGANLNHTNEHNSTFVHQACFYLNPGCVKVLLRRNADENSLNDDGNFPCDIVGDDIYEGARDNGAVRDILKMLARAPADRVWRRRGWLAMLNARKRATDKQPRRTDHGDEAEGNQHDGAESPPVLSSRRKLADGGKWVTDDGVHVHPSLRGFHWTVTKMIDVTDDLIFRTVVSYL